jgi:eukaryotic-like serine/threonine-protein kinase
MRVIIISDSKDYMVRLRHMLAARLPDIEVTEHDPDQIGKPGPKFDWSIYDLLLIEDRLGGVESGLAWLTSFGLRAKLPPTILIAEHADTFIEGKVHAMQATAYVLRDDLDEPQLHELLEGLGVGDAPAPRPKSISTMAFERDTEIVRKLAETSDGGGTDGYKFVRLIGQGAQSRVYLAERVRDQQTLVLKILNLEDIADPSFVKRFAREAELLASIDSPYVIEFFDHGFTPSFGYIAVEFFTRGDLKQRIENGISTEEALIYALNIAFGLEAIHSLDIVHRDLKPGNIMFRSDDSMALADFGISKHLDDSWDLTKTGAVIGTLSYLSPEQGLGHKVDPRTDLYALGMVLFEMLTGKKAFHASSPGALVYQHLYADVPRLPDGIARYQPIIAKLLAKDPNDRFQTASELVVNLEPYCGG